MSAVGAAVRNAIKNSLRNGIHQFFNNREILLVGDSYFHRDSDPYFGQYLNTAPINNEGYGGAKLLGAGGGGAGVAAEIGGHLTNHPTAEVVVVGTGANNVKDNWDTGGPDIEPLKAAVVGIIEEILDANRQLIFLTMPPIAKYEFLNVPVANGPEILAAVVEYNSWLKEYVPAVGGRVIDIHTALNDGSDGIADAYDLDGLHVNIAGSKLIANLVDAALLQSDIAQNTTMSVVRARPEPENLSPQDIIDIVTFVDTVADEWDTLKDVWLYKQGQTSSVNALTGLKGNTFTIGAGTPSYNSNGIVMPASSYLQNSFDTSTDYSTDQNIGQGIIITESPNDTDDLYLCGNSNFPGFSGSSFIRWQGGTLKTMSFNVGGANVTEDRSDNLGKCIESHGTDIGGGSVEHNIWISGVEQPHSANTGTAGKSANNFLLHAISSNSSPTTNPSAATYSVYYLTDGTNTPATWATAAEAVS